VVKGTVTISIKDYHELLDASSSADEQQKTLKQASKEIQVFLSFIVNQVDIEEHINSFNRQSTTSEIVMDNNRVKIKFKDETKINNSDK
jgi:hypothetical protein